MGKYYQSYKDIQISPKQIEGWLNSLNSRIDEVSLKIQKTDYNKHDINNQLPHETSIRECLVDAYGLITRKEVCEYFSVSDVERINCKGNSLLLSLKNLCEHTCNGVKIYSEKENSYIIKEYGGGTKTKAKMLLDKLI